jgi:predicted ester cyclase
MQLRLQSKWGRIMPPKTREHAALVRRFLTDVIVGGDTDALDAFVTEDVVDHNLVFGDGRGRETVTMLGWSALAAADVDVETEDVVAADDTVAVRATVTGTHEQSLMDLAPTGAAFEIAYVWFCRIDDGRIVEFWSMPDGLGLMQDLGAIPERSSNSSVTTQVQRRE